MSYFLNSEFYIITIIDICKFINDFCYSYVIFTIGTCIYFYHRSTFESDGEKGDGYYF